MFEQAEVQQKKLVSAQDLEIENKKLRETLAEYNTEFAHVKNQGTCTYVYLHQGTVYFLEIDRQFSNPEATLWHITILKVATLHHSILISSPVQNA